MTEAIGAVKTDLETAANQAHTRIEGNIKATEDRLSAQIGAVKTDLTATRSELTAAIEKQTDRIVEVHRDLRGLGERLARVEANP